MNVNELREAILQPEAEIYEIDGDKLYMLILPPSTSQAALKGTFEVLKKNGMRRVIIVTGHVKLYHLEGADEEKPAG